MNIFHFLSSSSPPPPPPSLNMQDLFQSSIPSLPGRIFSTTSSPAIAAIGSDPSSPSTRILGSSYPLTHHHHHHHNHGQQQQIQHQAPIKCPRCDSTNTKFCYYNNYNLSQPRHFCKSCRRYWTKGGVLRNVPVGGGCRKNSSKRSKPKSEKIIQQQQHQAAAAAAAAGSSSDSSSLNLNPDLVFSDTDGSLTGLMAAAGVSGFGFPDPAPLANPDQGLTGLEWPGPVDPTASIFNLAGPPVEPVMYWGDADLSSIYLTRSLL